MFKLSVSVFLFSAIVLFSAASLAQADDVHVIHFQNWKFKSLPTGDDDKTFNEMVIRRQSEVFNNDSRVLSSRVFRHNWGADSRDLIFITEFKNREDLFSFYEDLNSIIEKAFSQEVRDKDDLLWDKYVGSHSDEIYQEIAGTVK